MSTHGFIITRGGIIVVDVAVSPSAAMTALANAAGHITDDAACLADAWENSRSLRIMFKTLPQSPRLRHANCGL